MRVCALSKIRRREWDFVFAASQHSSHVGTKDHVAIFIFIYCNPVGVKNTGMNYVPGKGPANAKLAVVGEAPGGEEDRLLEPFVGPSGKLVDQFLDDNGSSRSQVYLTNVVKIRPPNNNLRLLHMIGRSIEEFVPQLEKELDALRPNCILAVGNLALETLTGQRGIKKWRGSILQSPRFGCKVVPTIHPAFIFHEDEGSRGSWKDLTYIKWDFARAIEESKTKEFDYPRRHLHVAKSSLDLVRFLDTYKGCKYVSVDIETFRTIPICIAFAFNRHEAISVPLFNIQNQYNPNGIGRHDVMEMWRLVADVLYDTNIFKIGQNFKFDKLLLNTCVNNTKFFGMPTRSFYFDTQLAFRILYPELPSKLEFITSVLTKEPYYKDEGKEYNPKKDKLDRLLLYNARDAVVTYEVFETELEELRAAKMEDFFFERVMPQEAFYSRVEQRGILVDETARHELDIKYTDMQKALEDELLEIVGYSVNVMSNGLKGQVAKLLYLDWKLPKRKGVDEKTLTALLYNATKDPKHKRGIELILEIRKVRKTRGTYIKAKKHQDGRMRTGYNLILESGRTSTRILKPPVTTEKMGLPFQTITKHGDVGSDLRKMFIPDAGHVFLEPDLSQAEDRVVGILARDEKGMLMYQYKIDKHRVTAGWIFDRCPDHLLDQFFILPSFELAKEINDILKAVIDEEERQLGKKFRHAGNYDMGERTAAINANVSVFKARKLLTKFHDTNANIRGVFHAEIQKCLQENNRILVNPFGRQRQFLNRWGHELFKEAYAQIPQSTISDQTKWAMRRIEARAPWFYVVQESHDSFLGQCPLQRVDETSKIIKEELEQPIEFTKCSLGTGTLVIPAEVKMGERNWEEMRRIL